MSEQVRPTGIHPYLNCKNTVAAASAGVGIVLLALTALSALHFLNLPTGATYGFLAGGVGGIALAFAIPVVSCLTKKQTVQPAPFSPPGRKPKDPDQSSPSPRTEKEIPRGMKEGDNKVLPPGTVKNTPPVRPLDIDIRLHQAVQLRDLNEVNSLIVEGVSVHTKLRGETALYSACQQGQLEIVKALLEAGAQVNEPSGTEGSTALHKACLRGDIEMVQVLLEYDAKVNQRDAKGNFPLHCALRNPEVVEILLQKGAFVNVANNDGITPLYEAMNYNSPELIKALVEAGAQIDWKINGGTTALHRVSKERLDVFKELLKTKKTYDINVKDSEGRTPYNYARMFGLEPIAILLVEHGAKTY